MLTTNVAKHIHTESHMLTKHMFLVHMIKKKKTKQILKTTSIRIQIPNVFITIYKSESKFEFESETKSKLESESDKKLNQIKFESEVVCGIACDTTQNTL